MKKILAHLKENWIRHGFETLAVLVGVLSAFTLNNWNEERKDRREEHQILLQLKQEYTSNLNQLDQKDSVRNVLIHNSNILLGYCDQPSGASADTLIALIGTLGSVPTFDPIANDIIESGHLRLIQDRELRQLLSSWTTEVVQLQEEERHWVEARNNLLIPFLIKNGIMRDAISDYFLKNATQPTDSVTGILINPEFPGVLSIIIAFNHVANRQSGILRVRISRILELIDHNLATSVANA